MGGRGSAARHCRRQGRGKGRTLPLFRPWGPHESDRAGCRRDRHRVRLVPCARRPRGDCRRAAGCRGAGDELRERRPDLGGPRRAVGEPGNAGEDRRMARPRGRAARLPAPGRLAPVDVGPAVPRRVPAVPDARQHPPDPRARAVQPHRAARAPPGHRHRVRPPRARHPDFLYRRGGVRTRRVAGRADAPVRLRTGRENRRGVPRGRARARARRGPHRRGHLHRLRRVRRCVQVHPAARRARCRPRGPVPVRTLDQAARSAARPDHQRRARRRRGSRRPRVRRCLRRGARELQSAARAAARDPAPGRIRSRGTRSRCRSSRETRRPR